VSEPSAYELLLMQKEAEYLAAIAAVRADLAQVRRARGASTPEPVVAAALPPVRSEQEDGNHDEALARLPLADAVIEYLGRCKPHPLSAKQIWTALEPAGVVITSEDPVRAVEWALRKRRKTHDDVFSAGFGTWDLKSKYPTRKLNRLIASRAGLGGRDKSEHVARTKAGMAAAKSKGRRVGAVPKISPELLERAEDLARQRWSLRAISKELRISTGSLYLYGFRRNGRTGPNKGRVAEAGDNVVQFAKAQNE
jgi:hypothetical protein